MQSISDLINSPGLVNLDFADVTAVMKDAGYAHMGVGSAQGKEKASMAALAAISSPLLETSINGARGVIINITSSNDINLEEVDIASTMITKAAHPDATIIWGAAFDENMDDEMRVTVIATGFSIDPEKKEQTAAPQTPKAPVRKAAPAPATNPKAPAGTDSNINASNDDDYFDIMTIFGRK